MGLDLVMMHEMCFGSVISRILSSIRLTFTDFC